MKLAQGLNVWMLFHFVGEKKEEQYSSLRLEIDEIVSDFTQSEPRHRDTKGYIKVTGEQVRTELMSTYGYSKESFCKSTINNVLNRLGYSLKKVQKVKPLKRLEQTDDIFENVRACSQKAQQTPDILRISLDVKDKVKIGELSRKGYCRNKQGVKALDKDQKWDAVLVPVGILEVESAKSMIVFGNSLETSDFIADALESWADERSDELKKHTTIQINLDNGPHVHSRRSQFVKRMAELACKLDKNIELVYYPPYHSKYNPIERVWAALENYWNGTTLSTIEKAVQTAKNITWKGIKPLVKYMDKTYNKGIKLLKKEMDMLEEQVDRSTDLPKWHVTIRPSQKMRTFLFN